MSTLRALTLADQCDHEDAFEVACARELRRLHAENEDFRATCDHLTSENAGHVGEIVVLKEQRDELLEALRNLADLYDTDEGCRSLPEYIAARAAIAQATGGCSMNTDRAAAPDLLLFAQDIADGVIVPELMTHEGLTEVLLRWQKAARAAIAKATGETK